MPGPRVYVEVRISKYLGALPYSGEFKFSRTWAIYSAVIIAVIVLSEFCRCLLMILEMRKTFTVELMRSIVKFERLGVIIIHLSTINKARDDFEVMMKSLTDSEGESLIHGRLLLYGLLSTIFYCIPRILEDGFTVMFLYFLWCITEVSNIMITRQFCIIITIIKKRISNVTKMMLSPTCSSRLAESLCEKHDQCLALATKANNFYSLQLLVTCIYISFKFLNLMVEIILYKPENIEARKDIVAMFGNAFHASTLLGLLFILAGSCENMKNEVSEFHSALFKTMLENPTMRENEWLNLYVEMRPTVEFSAKNFFPIGFSLVTSVVTAVSTYLVIIVQFNNGS